MKWCHRHKFIEVGREYETEFYYGPWGQRIERGRLTTITYQCPCLKFKQVKLKGFVEGKLP